MDNLRGTFGSGDSADEGQDWDDLEDEDGGFDSPPLAIGQDERRMQVRAYNHWASLLGERTYPSIEDLEPHNLDDFGPNSVLLDFSAGIDDPAVQFIGEKLGEECGTTESIEKLSDVPPRSLLSRITDHYMQILANEAPIGFEAEFVNLQGVAILYRGILLPFSSNDETIDFIYGVINWKEIADQVTSDELLLEIDQAIEGEEGAEQEDEPHKHHADPVTEWADSPAGEDQTETAIDVAGGDEQETGAFGEESSDPFGAPLIDAGNDDTDENDFGSNIAAFDPGSDPYENDDLPLPDFGQYALDDPEEEEFEEDEGSYSFASLSDYLEAPTKKVVDLDADRFDPGEYQPEYREGSEEGPSFGDSEDDALSPVDPVDAEDFDEDEAPDPQGDCQPAEDVEAETAFDLDEPGHADENTGPEAVGSEEDPWANFEDAMDDDQADGAEEVVETGEPVELEDALEPVESAHFEEPVEDASEVQSGDDEVADLSAFELTLEDIVDEQIHEGDSLEALPDEVGAGESSLYDCLAAARDLAESARTSEDRSRSALYAAVSRAYDVSLAAEAEPEAYEELLEDNGLVAQERAPMTPVVKLVFGSDYDKTRLTEYATALSHAHRLGIERGRLKSYLAEADGGLKGVVATERRLRREEAGEAVEDAGQVREKLAAKLRELEALAFDAIEADGAEFSLVMVRRDGSGELAVIGEIDDDIKLIERAARKLVG